MRYDLSTPLTDLDGEMIVEGGYGYTLGSVLLRTALFSSPLAVISPDAKRQCFKIAKAIKAGGQFVELTAEDVALLKKNAGAMWGTLVFCRLEELLEQPVSSIPGAAAVP